MVKILSLLKKYGWDIIFIIFLVTATFFAWGGILNQTIAGEGFYYFSPSISLFSPEGKITNLLFGFDNFAKIATHVLEKNYGGNIQAYINFQFLLIAALSIALYLSIKSITNNSLVSFLASIYAGINYTGDFQFYARGHFQWFLQRVPEVFTVLVSLVFLSKFLKSNYFKYYYLSLSFYLLSIFTSHYTSMFLPLFPALIFFNSILKKDSFKNKVKLILLSIPFILLNYYIVKHSTLGSGVIRANETFMEFLGRQGEIISKILFQLVVVTIPFNVLQLFREVFNLNYQILIPKLEIPVVSFYLLFSLILFKQKNSNLVLALASFFALLGSLFFTVYVNRVNVYNEVEQGRYYYVPAIYVGIILSTFICSILASFIKERRKFLTYLIVILLAFGWFGVNARAIRKKIKDSQYYFDRQRAMLGFLNIQKDKLTDGADVFVPDPPGSNAVNFLNKFYGKNGTNFLYLDKNWLVKLNPNIRTKDIYVFDFSEETITNKETVEIVDRSLEFRKLYNNSTPTK